MAGTLRGISKITVVFLIIIIILARMMEWDSISYTFKAVKCTLGHVQL